jgi:hypothetical protein
MSVTMMSVIMLNIVILIIIMMSITVQLKGQYPNHYTQKFYFMKMFGSVILNILFGLKQDTPTALLFQFSHRV